jgi:hypothetical protein
MGESYCYLDGSACLGMPWRRSIAGKRVVCLLVVGVSVFVVIARGCRCSKTARIFVARTGKLTQTKIPYPGACNRPSEIHLP